MLALSVELAQMHVLQVLSQSNLISSNEQERRFCKRLFFVPNFMGICLSV